MSDSFRICCRDCEVKLWIGQGPYGCGPEGHPEQGCFYSGEPKTMEALRLFLFNHVGHNLIFAGEEFHIFGEGDEYKCLDPQD